jgi:DCN1-like protein 4/5
MPRPRKRTATTPSTEELESGKRSKTSASSRSRQQFVEEKFSTSKLIGWFKKYTTDDPQTLGPEGMERFCQDIKVEPENIVMLVIAYRMQAKNMGYFTQCEWIKGLSDSEVLCDTPAKLQNKLNYFLNQLNDPLTFKSIFRFAYDFARVRVQFCIASLCIRLNKIYFSGQRSALNGH